MCKKLLKRPRQRIIEIIVRDTFSAKEPRGKILRHHSFFVSTDLSIDALQAVATEKVMAEFFPQ